MKRKAEQSYNRFLKGIQKKYGDKETDNKQLERIGKSLFGNKFRGVFSCDRIPVLNKGEYAIVNLDDSRQSGSHWVAVVKAMNNKRAYIYDSFGRKTFKILPELIKSGNGVIKMTENDKEQREVEENCGQRALAALCVYNQYGWQGLKWI